eukprot:TRINITY_DN11882_c0_g1_i1.p1 TRINITY_DN11882_c0_g1~~TRINITY_DN11882_c0_g1_i1.p1  ORF type:complete len:154 (+),score=12.23 TRINITY_DN11882_c0_g1_i1:259-720(+)
MALKLPKFATRSSRPQEVIGLRTPKIGVAKDPWLVVSSNSLESCVVDVQQNKIPTADVNVVSISLKETETDELIEDLVHYRQNFEECLSKNIGEATACYRSYWSIYNELDLRGKWVKKYLHPSNLRARINTMERAIIASEADRTVSELLPVYS